MKKIFYFIMCLITLLTVLAGTTGCRRETVKEFTIELPSTPVLTVRSKWAVVASSHLRLRERPTIQSSAITTLWRNNVIEIISRDEVQQEVEGKLGYWYKVAYDGLQGWVFGAYLEMFDSENGARRASQNAPED
ncbi:MAG: SH3 domain-containing protein [Spirochaetia bacterium]|nr:SH3 domain-containing protein [Spirochaetia bacterium]